MVATKIHASLAKDAGRAPVRLSLAVTDPEVVTELTKHPEGRSRDAYALNALRLGAFAIRQASGALDATQIQREGDRIIGEVREVLSERMNKVLGQYFDPASGTVPLRIEQLTKKNGELESLFAKHLDGDRSTVAQTLAKQIGEESPVFKLLSPDRKDGVIAALGGTIKTALDAQRDQLLQQFTLDKKDSALARLVKQVQHTNGELHDGLSEAISDVVGEFSLDNDAGALSRFRREVMDVLQPFVDSNHKFQSEVRTTLETYKARREEQARSTRHGLTFESACGDFLRTESERTGDLYEDVSTKPGFSGRKVGDHVVTLGPDSAAPDARIVFESKAQKKYTEKQALEEIAQARENREAQVGVFIFDVHRAPDMNGPLRRIGNDVLVIWDADDVVSDIYLSAALSLARALAIRERDDDCTVELADLEEIAGDISAHCETLASIVKAARTVKRKGTEILDAAENIRDALDRQVKDLNGIATALRSQA